MRNLLRSAITSSLWGHRMFPSTVWSNTVALQCSHNVTDQVSHPHNMTSKITFPCVIYSLYCLWWQRGKTKYCEPNARLTKKWTKNVWQKFCNTLHRDKKGGEIKWLQNVQNDGEMYFDSWQGQESFLLISITPPPGPIQPRIQWEPGKVSAEINP